MSVVSVPAADWAPIRTSTVSTSRCFVRVACVAGMMAGGAIGSTSSIATDAVATVKLLNGCRLQKNAIRDLYPMEAKRRSISGRVLVVVERTRIGDIDVTRIAVSNPPGMFDASVRRMIAAFRCDPINMAMQGDVSITFSMLSGPDFPHFDGVEDTIEIRGELNRP